MHFRGVQLDLFLTYLTSITLQKVNKPHYFNFFTTKHLTGRQKENLTLENLEIKVAVFLFHYAYQLDISWLGNGRHGHWWAHGYASCT